MDDATQKLVDEARAQARWQERDDDFAEAPEGVDESPADVADLLDRLADALEAAQRPPVSPEVRAEMRGNLSHHLSKVIGWARLHPERDFDPEWQKALDEATDALLARFSVPSQPVYDEEAIARWLFSLRYHSIHWLDAKEPERAEYRRDAAALVAALRGGELTREETTL